MDLRPTADRLRETLFNVLTPGNPAALEKTVWIDLYAGTGAVGIEAISRGAGMVYFVELASKSVNAIHQNLRSLDLNAGFEVLQQDAVRALRTLELKSVAADFVFLDPPYELAQAYHNTLEALADSSLLKPGSIVVAEHLKRFDPGEEFNALRRYRKLEQSNAALSFYRKEK